MANVIINDTHLTDIADSIRGKNGTNNKYKPSEMASAIDSITTKEDLDAELTQQTSLLSNQSDVVDTIKKALVGKGTGSGETPEYTRVDYIQFGGNQLIDTGIIGNQDTQICASFTWESSTQRHLYGCASSDNKVSITSYMNGSWRFGNKSSSKTFSSKEPKLPYSSLVNKTKISITNSNTNISGVANFETVGTLLLGGARDSDGSLPSVGIVGKVFYFYIWQGEEQVLKLVPVVNKNGVYGFLDSVSGNFFTSITDEPLEGGYL